jgi:hypothetical protein
LRHVRAFGAPCRVLLLGPDRVKQGKLRLPSARGRVLGWAGDGVLMDGSYRQMLGYIVLLDDGRIKHSRHVEIDERSLVVRGEAQARLHRPTPILDSTSDGDSESEDEDDGELAQASDPRGSSAVVEAEAEAEADADVSLGEAFDADGGAPDEPLVRDSVHRSDRES